MSGDPARRSDALSNDRPRADEWELSLFGPGYGESAVVHLGSGRWAIVDSCEDTTTKRAAAAGYLEALGVDVSAEVVLIVATHWHDDHVAGLAHLVDVCTAADFVCSAGLRSSEYMALLTSGDYDLLGAKSGVKEFAAILGILERRGRYPVWAKIGTRVWRQHGLGEVWALAPTDFALAESLRAVAGLLPEASELRRRVRDPAENHLSVATMFLLAEQALLLGGDLEERGRADYGWSAVLASAVVPKDRAAIFKVPHHGSTDAHHPDVWTNMLQPVPIAVVAPWERGGSRVPDDDARRRICSHTTRAYITSDARPLRPRRSRQAEKIIAESTRYTRSLDIPTGHVRVRGPLTRHDAEIEVELVREARPLCA